MNRTVGENQVNHWHTGSLNGTATILIRRHDGKNFVALLNTRVSPVTDSPLSRDLEALLHLAADEVPEWPAEDRFREFDQLTATDKP